MCDYEDLVKSLRYCAEYDCTTVCPRAGTGNGCITRLKKEAADAIVELQKCVEAEYQSGFADGQRSANRKKSKWISVEERLPEEEKTVLVVRKFLSAKGVTVSVYVETAELIGGDWVSMSDEYKIIRYRHTDPIYWMPLPEPPKESPNDSR